jgi:hypothetical protein
MEGRIGKARLLLRRRGHRLETEEEVEVEKKKKKKIRWHQDHRFLLASPTSIKKVPQLISEKEKQSLIKERIINIVPPPPCDFELIELIAARRLKKTKQKMETCVLLLET